MSDLKIRKCLHCEKEFKIRPRQHSKKFCSPECKWTHNNKNRTLKPNTFYTCVICGKSVEKYVEPSRRDVIALKYCSHRCQGFGFKGKGHPRWSGGKQINDQGYVLVYCPDHPNVTIRGSVREHILVMEKHIGRYLDNEEVVHHINGINSDNRIENLMLFKNQSEHKRFHESGRIKDKFGRYLKKEILNV